MLSKAGSSEKNKKGGSPQRVSIEREFKPSAHNDKKCRAKLQYKSKIVDRNLITFSQDEKYKIFH